MRLTQYVRMLALPLRCLQRFLGERNTGILVTRCRGVSVAGDPADDGMWGALGVARATSTCRALCGRDAEGRCVRRFGNGTETKEMSRENWS
jgi:hypothetical protein